MLFSPLLTGKETASPQGKQPPGRQPVGAESRSVLEPCVLSILRFPLTKLETLGNSKAGSTQCEESGGRPSREGRGRAGAQRGREAPAREEAQHLQTQAPPPPCSGPTSQDPAGAPLSWLAPGTGHAGHRATRWSSREHGGLAFLVSLHTGRNSAGSTLREGQCRALSGRPRGDRAGPKDVRPARGRGLQLVLRTAQL